MITNRDSQICSFRLVRFSRRLLLYPVSACLLSFFPPNQLGERNQRQSALLTRSISPETKFKCVSSFLT